jgi:ABC-type transporter Mla subunit MlaD
MLGLTIWKLESYTQVLRENSGKLNTLLSKVATEDYEILLLSGIIDTITTLDHAAERADGALATLSATWDQTVSDLDSLGRMLTLSDVAMDRLPQFHTLLTASATWAAILRESAAIQNLRFETATIISQPGA